MAFNNNSSPAGRQQTGTGFTNLSSILNANRGNRLGQTVDEGVNNTVKSFNDDTQNAYNNFQNQAKQSVGTGSSDYDTATGILNKFGDTNTLQSDPTTTTPTTSTGTHNSNNDGFSLQDGSTGSTSTSKPTSYNAPSPIDSNDSAALNKLQGGYQGPQGINSADQAKITNEAQDLNSLHKSSGGNAGRFSLLNRYIGGPQYTQGQRSLDNVLLNDGSLNAAHQATGGAQQRATNTINQAQTDANTYKANAANLGNYISGTINQDTNNLTGALGRAQYKQNNSVAGDYANKVAELNAAQKWASPVGRGDSGGQAQQYTIDPTVAAKYGIAPSLKGSGLSQANYDSAVNSNSFVAGTPGVNGIVPFVNGSLQDNINFGNNLAKSSGGLTPSEQKTMSSLQSYLASLAFQKATGGAPVNYGYVPGVIGKQNLGDYLQQATAPTLSDVTSNTDAARLNALMLLSGKTPTYNSTQSTYNPNNTFDQNQFIQDANNYLDTRSTNPATPNDASGMPPVKIPGIRF